MLGVTKTHPDFFSVKKTRVMMSHIIKALVNVGDTLTGGYCSFIFI